MLSVLESELPSLTLFLTAFPFVVLVLAEKLPQFIKSFFTLKLTANSLLNCQLVTVM